MLPLGHSKASQGDSPVTHSYGQAGQTEVSLREATGNPYTLIHFCK